MIGRDIDLAVKLLNDNEVIGIPTETVYGLAGNAFSELAVSKIFSVKNRPSFDPLIVHVSNIETMRDLVEILPSPLEKLARKFLPGPLTLLLQKTELIPDIVSSMSPLVAIRIPNHPMALELLNQLSFPLAAPSANPFGYISPTTAKHVEDQLGEKIPYILDGGPSIIGLESTIVGMMDGEITVYRKGGLSIEKINEVVGPVKLMPFSTSNPLAPGMLKSHYAPKAKVVISSDMVKMLECYDRERIGRISFYEKTESLPLENQVLLSEQKDYEEAARNLFKGMRYLDGLNLDVIVASLLPEVDLGIAINDRLRRAAAE